MTVNDAREIKWNLKIYSIYTKEGKKKKREIWLIQKQSLFFLLAKDQERSILEQDRKVLDNNLSTPAKHHRKTSGFISTHATKG